MSKASIFDQNFHPRPKFSFIFFINLVQTTVHGCQGTGPAGRTRPGPAIWGPVWGPDPRFFFAGPKLFLPGPDFGSKIYFN